MKYIGLDVHKKSISIAVINGVGKIVMESVIETKASMIVQFIEGLRANLQVTFEEGISAAWLCDLLKPQVTKLVEIFRLDVEQFRTDANVYDSLGEAYWKRGDKALAVENYKKSLGLNPQNENARDVLEKTGSAHPISPRWLLTPLRFPGSALRPTSLVNAVSET